LRVRTLRATLCSLTFLATLVGLVVPIPAFAAKKAVSGGTAAASAATPTTATTEGSTTTAGGSTTTTTSTTGGATTTEGSSTTTSPAATTTPTVHAPVTARTPKLNYKGPVYEKTATGAVVPYVVPPPAGKISGSTGGSVADASTTTKPELLVPGSTARYIDGLAAAPMSAPAAVQEIIWAGDQLIGLPYIYGGGHASFISPGYDCSGTVSFALHGASLIATPMDSSEFMGWGEHGVGRWVTIFTDPEHAYMTVAGLRLDTSPVDDPSNEEGPRWRPLRPGNPGFTVRHPVGL
jgi:cell wall-associated NlpC family hydrolase